MTKQDKIKMDSEVSDQDKRFKKVEFNEDSTVDDAIDAAESFITPKFPWD